MMLVFDEDEILVAKQGDVIARSYRSNKGQHIGVEIENIRNLAQTAQLPAEAPGANPGALPDRELSKLFVFNVISSPDDVSNRQCSRFCDGQNLTLQQLSTAQDFVMLNLKEFREERRVEHLVPNQIPTRIELCLNLRFLSDWY
jgi:hypothetical protein